MQGTATKPIRKFIQRSIYVFDKPLDVAALRYLAQITLLATAYFITAKWGLTLSPVSGFATFVWPPTGIALAALLLMGYKTWPGIFIGAFAVNFITGAAPFVALAIAAGNTAGPLTGSYLLRKFGFDRHLERIRDTVLLVCFAALLSTLISATIGTTSLLIGSSIQLSAYPFTWVTWWVGDSLGILIVAPLLMAWIQKVDFNYATKHLIEAGTLFILFVGLGVLIFDAVPETDPVLAGAPYLLSSCLIWAAVRFNVKLITLLIFLLSVMAVWSAKYGIGPFYSQSLKISLFATQLFMGATAVTFLIFASVIAERRRAQATVQSLNARLQQTLSQTTEKLREERALEKLRDEFVATASHELKTPVTSIKAYAQVLEQKLLKNKNAELIKLADGIDNQADILTQRVNELLDVSKVVEGKIVLNKSVFDLNSLLQRIVDDFAIVARSHAVKIKGVLKNPILADKMRIEQVLINLLTNAVKYSPPNRRVIVAIKTDKSNVYVSVTDKGPGIHKKDQTKIFKRFYRTEDNKRNKQAVSGMGLGLFISHAIIKQHGGKLWVESELGKGSVFIFTLPVYAQPGSNS
ncbi:MAG TPA: MASE1 domain-containing protein [Candidatus Saccharimonadales bacterium]|nr:MASE1 domain-containing protein [Candidatus Saccharimonadales bacterium]